MASVILNATTRQTRAVDGQVFADHGNGEIVISAYVRVRGESNKIAIARLAPHEAEDLVSELLRQLAEVA